MIDVSVEGIKQLFREQGVQPGVGCTLVRRPSVLPFAPTVFACPVGLLAYTLDRDEAVGQTRVDRNNGGLGQFTAYDIVQAASHDQLIEFLTTPFLDGIVFGWDSEQGTLDEYLDDAGYTIPESTSENIILASSEFTRGKQLGVELRLALRPDHVLVGEA